MRRRAIIFSLIFFSVQTYGKIIYIQDANRISPDIAEQLEIVEEAKYRIRSAEIIIEKARVAKRGAEENIINVEADIQRGRIEKENAEKETSNMEILKLRAEEEIVAAYRDIQASLVAIAAAKDNMRQEGIDIGAQDELLQKAAVVVRDLKNEQQTIEGSIVAAEISIRQAAEERKEAEANKQKTIVVTYPECKKVVVTQGELGHCPSGYSQILYSDMVKWETYDDIRICQSLAAPTENTECFGGYLVSGIAHPNLGDADVKSTGWVLVPKKMYSRVKFSNFFDNYMLVSIVNETTGQVIYNAGRFTNGQVVELPYSETQDQVFRFDPQVISNARHRFLTNMGKGVMIVYIDHINIDKPATEENVQKVQESIQKIEAAMTLAETTKKKDEEEKRIIEQHVKALENNIKMLEINKQNVAQYKKELIEKGLLIEQLAEEVSKVKIAKVQVSEKIAELEKIIIATQEDITTAEKDKLETGRLLEQMRDISEHIEL